jgi:hypothetical protein
MLYDAAAAMRILFFAENGQGLGHLRRASLVADAILDLEPAAEVFFLIEGTSTNGLLTRPHPVIQIPPLSRMGSDLQEWGYRTLVDELVAGIDPDVIVEDTYPDDRHLSIESALDVPRVLLLRRVAPLALAGFRSSGYLGAYARVVLLDDRERFLADDQVGEVELLARYSSRLAFVGPVFRQPSGRDLELIRQRYGTGEGRLIVVNAGAGGEWRGSIPERLYAAAAEIAAHALQAGSPDRFIVVLGPKFEGTPPLPSPNLDVVREEPLLPALVQIADVVIVRPGYNVVHEALGGSGRIIVVPDVSYLEQQRRWAWELFRAHGVTVCADPGPHALGAALFADSPPIARKPLSSGATGAAQHVLDVARPRPSGPSVSPDVWVVLGGRPAAELRRAARMLRDGAVHAHVVIDDDDSCGDAEIATLRAHVTRSPDGREHACSEIVFASEVDGGTPAPRRLVDFGIRVLCCTDRPRYGFLLQDFRHHQPAAMGLLLLELSCFEVRPRAAARLPQRLRRLGEVGAPPFLYFDCAKLTSEAALGGFCGELRDLVARGALRPLLLRDALSIAVAPLLRTSAWRPSIDEIDRIM